MDKLKWGCDEQKLRDSWDGGNLSFEKDRAYGFSWPQRNYRCSFCKKEFKSAQALGGHMNVHRRDRARMRLSPSLDSMKNPNPNPNPNFSSSSSTWSPLSPSAANYKGFSYNYSSIGGVTDSPSSGEEKVLNFEHSKKIDIKKVCREKGNENEGKMVELTRRKDARVWKANDQFVKLDLNMGLIQDSKEDLDLELRLGYS